MIPKIIHFCWLSEEPYPELVSKCLDSWKRVLPDYEIKVWNTENFDVNSLTYTKEAFSVKKYAFVSDYIRLYALYNEGGIYLDSDIEVLKSLNDLLDRKAFTGFEKVHNCTVAAWIFGTERKNPIFKEFLDYYNDRHFILPDGSYDMTPNPVFITEICKKKGLVTDNSLQKIEGLTVFPSDYFCPYNPTTDELNITDNTYCIHYFNGAWLSDEQKALKKKKLEIIRKYGRTAGRIYYGIKVMTSFGIKQFLTELWKFISHK